MEGSQLLAQGMYLWTELGLLMAGVWAGAVESGLDGQRDRLRDAQMQDGHTKVRGLMDMKDSMRGRCSEEAGGPLRPSASVCFGQVLRTLGLWSMGRWAELESSLILHPSLLRPFSPLSLPAEVLKFHRRHGQCCRRGTQIALLGLVFTALWAGLLTLLLLWREDTPCPTWPPPRHPLPDPGEPNTSLGAQFPHVSPTPSQVNFLHSQEPPPLTPAQHPWLPPFGHLPHDIPRASIPSWQVGCGWMKNPFSSLRFFLLPRLGH